MRWQVKCAIDTTKALVPFPRQLRRIKYSVWPFEEPAGVDRMTVSQGLDQIEWIRSAGHRIEGAVVLEIGSGWQPIIPLLFHLAGAGTVLLVDRHPLLMASTFRRAMRVLRDQAGAVAGSIGLTASDVERRLQDAPGASLPDLLHRFGLRYLAPCDARHLALEPGSVDVIVSRAVFEHIPPAILDGILTECRRVLHPSGAMCHSIDNSDHWAHRDKSITYVNFLKFGDRAWRLLGIQPQNYQNRLRHSEYRSMFRRAGYVVAREDLIVDARSMAALRTMRLAPRFRSMSADDLAGIESWFFLVPDAQARSAARAGESPLRDDAQIGRRRRDRRIGVAQRNGDLPERLRADRPDGDVERRLP